MLHLLFPPSLPAFCICWALLQPSLKHDAPCLCHDCGVWSTASCPGQGLGSGGSPTWGRWRHRRHRCSSRFPAMRPQESTVDKANISLDLNSHKLNWKTKEKKIKWGWELLLLNWAAWKLHLSLSWSLSVACTNNLVYIYFWHKSQCPVILDYNYNNGFRKACKWFWEL